LPYKVVAGVIPCRRGWLVASAKLQGVTIAPEDPRVMETIIDVIDEKPTFSVIALHAPIGDFSTGSKPAAGPATARHGPCSGRDEARPCAPRLPG